ncbi:MAG: SUMF1/EgtB/PvdO family nonheme iron enzyme [Candidatus Eisenbacteria bacterium]|nr:SUMF1/EgtB/PvdO family nonheme iron enzyme [Candidatus Eisenbacteria bacterium]
MNGDLTVSFETGIAYTELVTNGFGCAGGDFYEITDSNNEFDFELPDFTEEFDFETGASLDMSCLLYGAAGPHVAGRRGFQFTSVLNADSNPNELLFGLRAVLHAAVDIECDILELDYNRAFELYTHLIGEWVIPLPDTPILLVNPEELDFGVAQTQLDITIANGGGGGLVWSAADNRDWIIDVNPSSGETTTEEDVVTVTVNRDGLDPGEYAGEVTVSPDEGDPVGVAVRMSVEEELVPLLVVTPTELDFGSQGTELTLEIANGGAGTLGWSIAEPEETWIIDVDPDSGTTTTETDVVTVTVDRAGLPPGRYLGSVTVTPGEGASQDVEIGMSVHSPGPGPGEMVAVSSGTFTMGSPGDEYGRESDETLHTVTLTTPFSMSSTEVTNQEYADLAQWAYTHGYCTATSSSLRDALDGSTRELLDLTDVDCEISFNGGKFIVASGRQSHPVMEVTWYGAAAFCDWLSLSEGLPRAYEHDTWHCNGHDPYNAAGYRLPTEAEWEYACRADTQTPFYNGICLESGTEANYNGNYPTSECPSGPYAGWTVPVGSYPANAFGLYDMHGNVSEWCNDWYGTYGDEAIDPAGPEAGSNRVGRGGDWDLYARYCRSAARGNAGPVYSSNVVGFRLVRSIR